MHIDQIRVLYLAMPLAKPEIVRHPPADDLRNGSGRDVERRRDRLGRGQPRHRSRRGSEWAHGAFLCLKEWLAPELLQADLPTARVARRAAGPRPGQRGRQSGPGHGLVESEGAAGRAPAGRAARRGRENARRWSTCRWGRSLASAESIDELIAERRSGDRGGPPIDRT